MRQKSSVGVYIFSLVMAAGFVALVLASGKPASIQNMAAHTQLAAEPTAAVFDGPFAPDASLRLIEDRSTRVAPDALIRPGLEIEDGTAYLRAKASKR